MPIRKQGNTTAAGRLAVALKIDNLERVLKELREVMRECGESVDGLLGGFEMGSDVVEGGEGVGFETGLGSSREGENL